MDKILIIFFLPYAFLNPGSCLDRNVEDQSINEIIVDEIKPELMHEHAYYLPQQTVFGSPSNPKVIDASKTLPPHITINPATTMESEHKTEVVKKESMHTQSHSGPYSSYCIQETPSDADEESEFLLPSRNIMQKNVVLSGYEETPAKTSDDFHASEVSHFVSISSDVTQEGHISVGNTSADM